MLYTVGAMDVALAPGRLVLLDVEEPNRYSAYVKKLGFSRSELRLAVRAIEREEFVETSLYASLLRRCGELKAVEDGRRVYVHIEKSNELNTVRFGGDTIGPANLRYLRNTVIDMYCKCGHVEEARACFDVIGASANNYSWTRMIQGYARNGYLQEALALFRHLHQLGISPDDLILSTGLSICAELEDLVEGRSIHARIVEAGYGEQLDLLPGLMDMYAKCGDFKTCWEIFDSVSVEERDAAFWSCMIAAYTQHGHPKKALQLLHEMDLEGVKPTGATFVSVLGACPTAQIGAAMHKRIRESGFHSDIAVRTAVIDMYGKFGRVEEASQVFETLIEKPVNCWNAIIGVHVKNDGHREAFRYFQRMQLEGVKPDLVVFVTLVAGCGSLAEVKALHELVAATRFGKHPVLGNALLGAYGKFGSLDDAIETFDTIEGKKVSSWNSLMAVYSQHDLAKEVIDLLSEMEKQRVKLDVIAILHLLEACASLAALEKGKEIYETYVLGSKALESDLQVKTSMVNLYGKCGRVEEVRRLFEKDEVAPDVVLWNAMMQAYAQHGFYNEVVDLYSKMALEGLQPNDRSFLSLLTSINHSDRRIREAISQFSLVFDDYGVVPTIEHYSCLVDILARAGRLSEAEELLFSMPVEADLDLSPFKCVLNACKLHSDFQRGAVLQRSISRFEA